MFTWNRVEVLVTLSLEYYRQVQAVLQKNQITNQSRQVKIAGQAPPKNGMLQRRMIEYHLYVHRDDLEKAQALIQTIGPDSGCTAESATAGTQNQEVLTQRVSKGGVRC